jgi:hypothetical protein
MREGGGREGMLGMLLISDTDKKEWLTKGWKE